MFTSTQIEKLLSQESISERYPWSTEDIVVIEEFYKGVCENILHDTGTLSRIEWNHYGSGYASFIDAWFYKTTADFNIKNPLQRDNDTPDWLSCLAVFPHFMFSWKESVVGILKAHLVIFRIIVWSINYRALQLFR